MTKETGNITVDIKEGIGSICFSHPKKNSLPGELLRGLANEVTKLGVNQGVQVIVLRSIGDGAFCAGASFTELLSIDNFERGKEFFMGFARLILAMKKCPKFIITRVQGKVVGGGVGMVAASDYALALNTASIQLSELALGIGPFVVGPAIERKIGAGPFSAMALDAEWRDAAWALNHGLYAKTFGSLAELDAAISALAEKLAKGSPEAMAKLKTVFWQGTDDWDKLLESRAEISGRLVLSDFTAKAIAAFKAQLK